jgi:hypothetical protein
MEAPVAQAGNKMNCLQCGQRLQIPSAERAKTILASELGLHDSVEQHPPQSQPTIPTAEFAPALPPRPVPTARPAIPPSEPPAPILNKSPRARWLVVGAMAFLGCLACFTCAGGSTWLAFRGSRGWLFAPPGADLVGKWEQALGWPRREFRADGTGEDILIEGKGGSFAFKWEVDHDGILIIDGANPFLGGRQHFRYAIEGDTLTLTSLQPGIPAIVFRRVK